MRTRFRHHITGWVLIASLLGCVSLSRADRVTPDCSADPACLNLYERAKAASNAGDLDEALRLYKLAYDVRDDPLLLYSIARILHKQGKAQDAVSYYSRFLAAPSSDPVPRKKAEEYLAQIREQSQPAPGSTSPPKTSEGTNPSPAAEPKPIYKKWWFWTLLGVGVAGGVAAGVAVATTREPVSTGLPDGVPTMKWTF